MISIAVSVAGAVVISGVVAAIGVMFDAQKRRHAEALWSSVLHIEVKDGE